MPSFILRTGADMGDGSIGGYIYSNFVTNSGSRTEYKVSQMIWLKMKANGLMLP